MHNAQWTMGGGNKDHEHAPWYDTWPDVWQGVCRTVMVVLPRSSVSPWPQRKLAGVLLSESPATTRSEGSARINAALPPEWSACYSVFNWDIIIAIIIHHHPLITNSDCVPCAW